MKKDNMYSYLLIALVLAFSFIYLDYMNKSLDDCINKTNTLKSHVSKIEEELNISRKQVSILERSIGSKDKRLAKIKQVRNVIQEDIRKNNLGNKISINDITSISTSVVDYSEEFDVPVSLLAAIVKSESGYDPLARSITGAKGVMQLMDGTAEENALELGLKYYNVDKISDNIKLGAHYTWKNLKRFKGNVELTISAYNCGPQYVERVIAKQYPDYPDVTKKYLITVLKNKKMFEDAGL